MRAPIRIQAIGGFFEKDEQGFLLNPCSLVHLSVAERSMLNFCYTWCQRQLGESLHSLWLRGSIARGMDRNSKADLDLFVLVKNPALIHWTPIAGEEVLQERLLEKFGVQQVECMTSGLYEEELPHPRMRMMIATQSILIGGTDIRDRLPQYRIDSSLLLNFRWMEEDYEIWQKGKMDAETEHSFFKAIIRTAREITQKRSGRYSPDLFYCCTEFSRYYPRHSADIWQLLWHFLHPHSAKAKAKACVHRLLPFLLKEISRLPLC